MKAKAPMKKAHKMHEKKEEHKKHKVAKKVASAHHMKKKLKHRED